MFEKNVEVAVAYYQAANDKNPSKMGQYLHPDVQLISPMQKENVVGKENVLAAIKPFVNLFKTLSIRFACGAGNQVMLAQTLDCPEPIGTFQAAVHMTFKDGLIIRTELFHDTQLFQKR